MKPILIFLISQSILLPFITGLIRLRRIGQRYQPFYIFICIGLVSEIVSFIIIIWCHAHNAIPLNIYYLLEWIMIA